MSDKYILRSGAIDAIKRNRGTLYTKEAEFLFRKVCSILENAPAADVAPVVRCKDCKYSTLPSELTQRYGKAGTLTCHNKYSPCNRRNVSENDFCSYGETE